MAITEQHLAEIASTLQSELGGSVYHSWFDEAVFFADEDGALGISVRSPFVSNYIVENFIQSVTSVAETVLGAAIEVRITDSKPNAGKLLRSVPDVDRQYSLFLPAISEIAIKDDVHLMEIAPFTLQPRQEDRNRLTYRGIEGMDIDITAHPDYGLPTVIDYDIVLMMQSNLAHAGNIYRRELEHYQRERAAGRSPETPAEPPRTFRPTTSEIMEFTRDYDKKMGKRHGAKQAAVIEERLDRLKHCNTKIRRTSGRKRRIGTFSFIQDWRITSETDTGYIQEMEIDIPNWIYEGIIHAKNPTILTYDEDYHLIKKPVLRFLYRFLRVKMREEQQSFLLEDIHRRSGSRQPLKAFNRDLSIILGKESDYHFMGWNLRLTGAARQRSLTVTPARQALAS